MVKRQVVPTAAVNTLVTVALEDVLPAQGYLFIRQLNVADQPDDGRIAESRAHRAKNFGLPVAYHFGFVQE